MRISLRGLVAGAFALLMLASAVQGILAISTTASSGQQVTALERSGLAPVVGLSILSQNLDQERALLAVDVTHLTPDQARALHDDLAGLDDSIMSAAPRVLPAPMRARWQAAWAAYVRERAPFLQLLANQRGATVSPATGSRISNRLDTILDLVQSQAGAQLNSGERLYAHALETDWRALRIVILSLVLTLLVGASLSYLIIRRLTRGLGNLATTAARIAEGAVEVRADERGTDEIARLSTAFNRMTVALLSAEQRADTDALSGLPNHRAMIAGLDRELERAHRYARPFAALFFDLDHFKAVNDTYGHAAGDQCLREFAAVAGACLRSVDLLGRWGGEEFVAILPEVTETAALRVAEQVRAAVADYCFSAGGGSHMTCSIGVALYPAHAASRDELVEAADRAMYGAKRFGRNQARVASDPAILALLGGVAVSDTRDEAALLGMVEALASLVEARDLYTGRHAQDVAELAEGVARALGFEDTAARHVRLAARLHDVGKIALPDALLRKQSWLTEEEWTLVRRHPVVGAEVISHVPALRVLAPLIRSHHERWDGQGYPDGLAGDSIPLGARIVAVADAYGALTSDRPYRKARSESWALDELHRCAGAQFDALVVEALTRVIAQEQTSAHAAAAG